MKLTRHQQQFIDMLRADSRRDIYEGCSGGYWVTYSADERYQPLTWEEVEPLLSAGLIRDKWPHADHLNSRGYSGCFVLVVA